MGWGRDGGGGAGGRVGTRWRGGAQHMRANCKEELTAGRLRRAHANCAACPMRMRAVCRLLPHLHQPAVLGAMQHARQRQAAGVVVGPHLAPLLQPAPQQPAALQGRWQRWRWLW